MIKNGHVNGIATNGHVTNGNATNGHSANGHVTNGHAANGTAINGHTTNGTAANGAVTNGHALNGNATNEYNADEHNSEGGQKASANELPLLFPLTASSEAALDAMPGKLHQWLSGRTLDYSALKDLSYTLSCRRSLLRWRKVLVASSVDQLQAESQVQKVRKFRASPSVKVAFVFTGQGAQWATMGRDLLDSSKVFRDSIERSTSFLKDLGCEWDLIEELAKPDDKSRISESAVAQPATTILQIGLVDLLEEFGVRPRWVVGHSSGEIAGAYAAGALTQVDAVRA
jgi:acyl transferase domain-containing protein